MYLLIVHVFDKLEVMILKENRRIKYTKLVLKNSLLTLLKEKQITDITVKELCEQADVNRSTFYSHYANHFDLKTQIENEMIEDLTQYLRMDNIEENADGLKMTEKLLEYIATRQTECEALLNENKISTFQKKVEQLAHQSMMKNQLIKNNFNEYVRAFIISGSIQMIRLWLDNGLVESPKEIASLINQMVQNILMQEK